SANLGACVQPCRFGYSKENEIENLDHEREVTLIEDEHGTYFFNSHDLCMIEYIDQLMEAGVNSFKGEGRTKSVFYIGMAMKAYRSCIDLLKQNNIEGFKKESKYWKSELEKLVNRGYSSCFMFGDAVNDPSCETNSHLTCNYRFVGEIVDDGTVFVHNKIIVGDIVEIIPVKGENYPAKISKIINPRNNEELQEFSAGNDKSYVELIFEKEINLEPMTLIMKDYKN
ncbi:MAG: U32 family peptidase C-terminal domain-containing protein, partial [Patescibacteria group bacterium]